MSQFALSCLRAVVCRTWLVASITVVCCAALAARAAAALVDGGYLTDGQRTAPARPALPPPAPRVRPDGTQLVERNMFCSSCGPPSAPSAAPVGGALALPAELLAIDVNHEARATVRVLASAVQGSWGPGDTIPGLGHIDRFGPTWVEIIDDAGHRGRLSLLDPPVPPGAPAPGSDGRATAGPVAGDPSTCGPAAAGWIDRIRRIDDQSYEVDRELVRELVTGASKAGSVRAVPVFENGEIKGIRLLGVTPCTIAGAVGLASRDLLNAIDGAPLKNLQQLFDLYVRLDHLNVVELSGTRAGKPILRTLRLR
jgi:hypothetical protein